MKAMNIMWDTDGDRKVLKDLPTEIEIPEDLAADYKMVIRMQRKTYPITFLMKQGFAILDSGWLSDIPSGYLENSMIENTR